MAITSLVLGLLAFPGICCYGVPGLGLGIAAIALGRVALGRIRASNGAIGGAGLAQAGWICGLVAAIISAIYLVFTVGVLVFSVATGSFASPAPSSP